METQMREEDTISRVVAWLDHQLEHGFEPGGQPIKMERQYALGRRAAFEATRREIDAALANARASRISDQRSVLRWLGGSPRLISSVFRSR